MAALSYAYFLFTFKDDGVHIVEQIRAKDQAGREIRKVELERLLTIDDAGNVKESEPPLWNRIVVGSAVHNAAPETKDEKPVDTHAQPLPPKKGH